MEKEHGTILTLDTQNYYSHNISKGVFFSNHHFFWLGPFPLQNLAKLEDVVQKMERCGTSSGKPTKKITVHSCGEETSGDEPPAKKARSGDTGEVQVLHIIRKHSGSRRPSSWRQEAWKSILDEVTRLL